jgi:hypothetical protein
MDYEFVDAGDRSCAEIVCEHRHLLLGRTAVCTSFDSGTYGPSAWVRSGRYRVSSAIDESLIAAWPTSHDGFCDEWWVFDLPVPEGFEVRPFCNFVGMRIADYRDLDWSDGCPLDEYLARFRPLMVFGNNERSYVIRRR